MAHVRGGPATKPSPPPPLAPPSPPLQSPPTLPTSQHAQQHSAASEPAQHAQQPYPSQYPTLAPHPQPPLQPPQPAGAPADAAARHHEGGAHPSPSAFAMRCRSGAAGLMEEEGAGSEGPGSPISPRHRSYGTLHREQMQRAGSGHYYTRSTQPGRLDMHGMVITAPAQQSPNNAGTTVPASHTRSGQQQRSRQKSGTCPALLPALSRCSRPPGPLPRLPYLPSQLHLHPTVRTLAPPVPITAPASTHPSRAQRGHSGRGVHAQ